MELDFKVPVLQGTPTKFIPRIYSVYMAIIKKYVFPTTHT